MIKLTDEQSDALLEICNIGISKAAVQLSKVVASNVQISIDSACIKSIEEIFHSNLGLQEELVSAIYTHIQGVLEGSAFLMIKEKDSKKFLDLIVKNVLAALGNDASYSEQDIFLEFGNIIISSAVRVMADALSETIHIDLPETRVDYFNNLVAMQADENKSSEQLAAIVVSSMLQVESHLLKVDLLLIFKLSSIKRLLKALNGFINNTK